MSENKSTTVNVGGGFSGLLTLIFITLKLTGFIGWSWVWVLSPVWISIGLILALLIIAGIIALIANALD